MTVSSPKGKQSYYLNYTADFDGADRQPHSVYKNDYTVTIAPRPGPARLLHHRRRSSSGNEQRHHGRAGPEDAAALQWQFPGIYAAGRHRRLSPRYTP